MPNRILKESICTSEDINELKPFEETFFYRLIVKCDDFGRYDARPKVLKAALFPLKDSVTVKNIGEALRALASLGLVEIYEVDGKPFLFLPTWEKHQQKRAKESKWPEPISSDINCNQSQANVLVFEKRETRNEKRETRNEKREAGNEKRETRNEKRETRNEKREAGNGLCADAQETPDDLAVFSGELRDTVRDWFNYKAEKRQPYKPTGRKSLITEIQNNVNRHSDAAVVDVIRQSMSSNYQGIVWDWLAKPRSQPPGKSGNQFLRIAEELEEQS